MASQATPEVIKAKYIIQGQREETAELHKLAETLKDQYEFSLARRLLAIAREQGTDDVDLRRRLAQRHALCTYKDPDLPAASRLDQALEILKGIEDLKTTQDQETLGLAGAIYKRKWEWDGQKQNLERSLSYYHRGYELGPTNDYGYTSINAAFVLDLLAQLEEREADEAGGHPADTVAQRRDFANRIRRELTTALPPLTEASGQPWLTNKWWFHVTLAEAYFGLKAYDDAEVWLQKAKALEGTPDWEYEATAKQLATLAQLHEEDHGTLLADERARAVLTTFLEVDTGALDNVVLGKVGLALSGGGFRASLYHIGVLARLAELDILRHIEVLSCVSGGSIIGAHYYLEVQKLLEEKADTAITRDDYVTIVERIANDFLAGVQRNLRTRVAANPLLNLKMLFSPSYSRTLRIGELYEQELFKKVQDGRGDKPRWMNDLLIHPLNAPENFAPKRHNWRRRAKVPILVLNTTSLNTGHVWQFTASWMGEPPEYLRASIDHNYRLRRMYYTQAPPRHQRIRLGHAVAASSCVPGLFEPLELKDLYKNVTVRLVDGGVHDNQGVASLLEQDCRSILVSDASGQMASEDEPSKGILKVPLRSNSILMDRVRETQYQDLSDRQRSLLLRGLMFVHLKKDLDMKQKDWIDCDDPKETPAAMRDAALAPYGILKRVQERLAAIRTDLDSFCDAEAYALMTSGYRMTEEGLKSHPLGFEQPAGNAGDWSFLSIEDPMKVKAHPKHDRLTKLLDVARDSAFKIWRLVTPLKITSYILIGLAALGFIGVCVSKGDTPLVTISTLGKIAVGYIVAALGLKGIFRIIQYRKTLSQIGITTVLAIVGWLLAWIHLGIFDRWYLRYGKIDNFSS